MPPISLSLAVFLPIIAILLLTRSSNNYELTSPNLSFSSPQTQDFLSSQESGSQDSLSSPYYASWRTWFHPHRTGSVTRSREGGWNVLYHLGGIGPWVEMDSGKEERGIEVPETCTVDQVHMMSRHAERYPTTSVGRRHLTLLDRIQGDAGVVFNGSLAFLNNWTYFTSDPKKDFDQLTATGPYAGTLDAFTTGVRYRTRYGHLLPRNDRTRFWASDSPRVIETAQLFASGLFGLDWLKKGDAELEVIPETFERGADTLTPGDTCLNYLEDAEHGHDHGLTVLSRFQDLYTPGISERLVSKEGNEAVGNFTSLEVYAMQEMCGFEIMTRGSSPWCDAFTEGDWDSFEYSRDLVHYYRAGPGNPYAGAMGWLFLNATAALLQSGPKAGTMFFSFVHDGDIAPFLTALDIFNDSRHDPHLPIEHIPADRAWRTSSILPMGARVTLERMTCSQAAAGLNSQLDSDADAHQVFVRVNVNDGIVQLPYCDSGPGGSCPLDEFVDFVQRRRAVVGDFGHVCGLRGDAGLEVVEVEDNLAVVDRRHDLQENSYSYSNPRLPQTPSGSFKFTNPSCLPNQLPRETIVRDCDKNRRLPWSITSSHSKSAQRTKRGMSYPGATSTKSAFWSECLISFRLILYLFFVAIYFIYGMKKRKRRKKNSTNQIATTNMNNNSESRNPRRPPEESGPFGRRRNARYDHARSRTRTGTPAKRENPNVAEFTRLFSQQQEKTAQQAKPSTTKTSSTGVDGNDGGEKVATECVLFGYRSKDSEWKVIDKFEKISQGFICEDYPRSDPSLTSRYSELLSGGDVVIRANLTADANRKSKRFAGGFHWIKVTFDSRAAADRAIYYAPQDIEGYHVFCRLYDGHGPQEDVPLPVDSEPATMALELHARDQHRPLNVPVVATPIIPDLLEPTPRKTPRGKQQQFVTGNLIDLDVGEDEEDISDLSTATASSATATEMEQLNRPFPALLPTNTIKTPSPSTTTATVSSSASTSTSFSPNTLRQRHFSTSQTRRKSQPQPQPQPPQNQTPQQHSEYMSHLPAVRKAELRPMTEALPPQPTVVERVLRSIPILSWFTGDIVGDGPQLREDGSFDYERSNVYWRFWYAVDRFVGTDVCGLKEEVY